MTKTQRKALEILRDHGPMYPREFAERMWPDSPGWNRWSRCGPSGSVKGGGMPYAGAGYLGRLSAKGWVQWNVGKYSLTAAGRKLLKDL